MVKFGFASRGEVFLKVLPVCRRLFLERRVSVWVNLDAESPGGGRVGTRSVCSVRRQVCGSLSTSRKCGELLLTPLPSLLSGSCGCH